MSASQALGRAGRAPSDGRAVRRPFAALKQKELINLTTGSNNIDIGNGGVAAESGKIRIGAQGKQTATFTQHHQQQQYRQRVQRPREEQRR